MSRNSWKPNGSGIYRVEHYERIILELFKKQGTFPTGVMKEIQGVMAQNNGKECQDSLPLFAEEIRGLSKCDMEILKHALHDICTILDSDVDEILGQILAISEFGSEKLLSSNASRSYEDGNAPASTKKRKTATVSLPDTYKKVHGHISSEIFEQLSRDIQAEESGSETRKDVVTKFSHELLRKLGKMAKGVDYLLDTVASKCSGRSMTTAEKLELGKRIRKLPEKALDRMVEIIETRRPENQSSDKVSINLGRLDDATLWRLYYYVETTLKAEQDLTTTLPQISNVRNRPNISSGVLADPSVVLS